MRRVLLTSVVGALLGGLLAYIGATRVFVCDSTGGLLVDDGFYEVLCAPPNGLLAVIWGIPIGLGFGLIVGLILVRSRRRPN